MKKLVWLLPLLLWGVSPVWAIKCDSDTAGHCCDCSFPILGSCFVHTGNEGFKCRCDTVVFGCSSSGECVNGSCKLLPTTLTATESTVRRANRLTPETLSGIPWATTLWIDKDLAANSTLPNPELLYQFIINTELRNGPIGHHGYVIDPEKKLDYLEWFDLEDNVETHHTHLTIWLDSATHPVWQLGSDTHESPLRLPVAETVDFYPDHWKQTNAKGTFTGKVEPF